MHKTISWCRNTGRREQVNSKFYTNCLWDWDVQCWYSEGFMRTERADRECTRYSQLLFLPLCSPCNNKHKLRATDTNIDRSHGKIQTMIRQWVGTPSVVQSAFDSWWQSVQAESNLDSDQSRICSTHWTCFILQVNMMMPIVFNM